MQNHGEQVTLRMMTVITARITGTLYDDQTLAVYAIDEVLLPKELFVDGLDLRLWKHFKF